MNPKNHRNRPKADSGFSLVEIAIGLVILSLAAVGMIASLSKQLEQQKVVETRQLVDSARASLIAFASTNGRLPCPANATSAGQESILSAVGSVVTCTAENGFLPAVTLGLPNLDANGLLPDAFADGAGTGNGTYLRSVMYGISSLAAPVANALTSPALGLPGASNRRQQIQAAINTGQAVFVCRSAAGAGAGINRCGSAANTLSANAVAVVWSRGINGNNPASYSADETQNTTHAIARVFVSRDFAPPDATGGQFDDIVSWISFPVIADRLLVGGHVM
ncbi:MAG: type II secretion system protein [Burkholderiaceae bacterium]